MNLVEQKIERIKVFGALIAGIGAVCLTLLTAPAAAQQDQNGAQDASAGIIEEITVVGSRRRDRSAADSPVPVDIISAEELAAQGDSNLDSLISSVVPSYNVSQEPISDAATFIRPATLRGLSPDATLVLVNGKRRHRAAVITLLGSGISGGAQGPDVSAIPAIALERLEVLRDGAAAQYGSDAIAGIMNFVLKEYDSGGALAAKWGSHYEQDGDAITLSGNIGLPLTSSGFANLSFEWKESDPTDRSVQRGDAQSLINAGNDQVRNPAQIWGAPEYSDDIKLFGNFGIDLDNDAEIYAFGNYAERQVEGGFYFRNPHTRGGVFAGPTVDAMGNTVPEGFTGTSYDSVKVADLSGSFDPDMPNANCPNIPIIGGRPDGAILGQVLNDSDGVYDDCYSLYSRFPGGFTPQFGGNIEDYSFAIGYRGEFQDWFYDASVVTGESDAQFYIYNTINPQLLGDRDGIDTYYDAGTYTENDTTVNINLSRPVDIAAFSGPLNVAFGAEYRKETFEITPGEPNSQFIDRRFGLPQQGFGVGSNGFPGFQDGDGGEHDSVAYGVYLDLEADVTDRLLLGAALRYEDYDDFGDTLNGKLAARFQATDTFALRGAFSTGFRVPTAGQANLRNVTTEFQSGMLADVATLPPTNPIAQQLGAQALEPEESTNITLGAVFELGSADVTIDYYDIEIEDRIAFTSRFALTQEDIDALLQAGVTDASSFSSVRFFTNQQTVEARGVDLVVTLPFDLGRGSSTLTAVANWSDVELTRLNPDFTSDNLRSQIEEGRPDTRFVVNWSHLQGPWRFMTRARYYGEYYDATTNDPSVAYYPDTEILVDFETAYDVSDQLTLVVGAQNLLDNYPEKNPNGEVAGLEYPESSPYGFNGGFYYLRARWEW